MYGPSQNQLALALFHKWGPERLFVIVTVYIDESGTHEFGVTILGGWVGRLGRWAGFDLQWNKLLKKSKIGHFHSKSMRSSKGEFRGWKIFEKFVFTQDAAAVALKHLEFGFTVSVTDTAYRDHYIAGLRPKEIPLDTRYGLCFHHWLVRHAPRTWQLNRSDGRDVDVRAVLRRAEWECWRRGAFPLVPRLRAAR